MAKANKPAKGKRKAKPPAPVPKHRLSIEWTAFEAWEIVLGAHLDGKKCEIILDLDGEERAEGLGDELADLLRKWTDHHYRPDDDEEVP